MNSKVKFDQGEFSKRIEFLVETFVDRNDREPQTQAELLELDIKLFEEEVEYRKQDEIRREQIRREDERNQRVLSHWRAVNKKIKSVLGDKLKPSWMNNPREVSDAGIMRAGWSAELDNGWRVLVNLDLTRESFDKEKIETKTIWLRHDKNFNPNWMTNDETIDVHLQAPSEGTIREDEISTIDLASEIINGGDIDWKCLTIEVGDLKEFFEIGTNLPSPNTTIRGILPNHKNFAKHIPENQENAIDGIVNFVNDHK